MVRQAARGVLMVAYYFPPVGGVGVFRTLKFSKYLPEFGFVPIILTVRNRSTGALDSSLVSEVPREATVIETLSAEHRALRAPRLLGLDPKWFFIPDEQIGWIPFALRRGEAAIRRYDARVIYATAPPFTGLIIGHLLKRRTGRPLVIDFRDPWTQNVFTHYPTRFHRRAEERMERSVLRSADWVITTTAEMRKALVDRHPFIAERSETILNGFDSADFGGLERMPNPNQFTITYTGKIYGLRTAEPFLAAVARFVGKDESLRRKVHVIFAGPKDADTGRTIHRLGLHDVAEQTGFLSHRESLRLMINADVLLLIMSERELGAGPAAMMIPGKTFEYLAARRPILALVPGGDAAALLTRSGAGILVGPDDIDGIEAALIDLFDRWRRGALTVPLFDLSVFERRSQTERLAAIFGIVSDVRIGYDGPVVVEP